MRSSRGREAQLLSSWRSFLSDDLTKPPTLLDAWYSASADQLLDALLLGIKRAHPRTISESDVVQVGARCVSAVASLMSEESLLSLAEIGALGHGPGRRTPGSIRRGARSAHESERARYARQEAKAEARFEDAAEDRAQASFERRFDFLSFTSSDARASFEATYNPAEFRALALLPTDLASAHAAHAVFLLASAADFEAAREEDLRSASAIEKRNAKRLRDVTGRGTGPGSMALRLETRKFLARRNSATAYVQLAIKEAANAAFVLTAAERLVARGCLERDDENFLIQVLDELKGERHGCDPFADIIRDEIPPEVLLSAMSWKGSDLLSVRMNELDCSTSTIPAAPQQ